MISRIAPTEFIRRVGSGKTRPALLSCEVDEDSIEVFAKLAAGCEQRETSLAMEMVSVLLAGDLEIPVPQPFFLYLEPEFVEAIPDTEWRGMARVGPPLAFGSRALGSGYSAWVTSIVPVGQMVPTLANILLFDTAIENPDRRGDNPNCLVRGDEVRVFDHDLAFPTMLIGAKKPWVLGALDFMEKPGIHIFRDALRGRELDWRPIVERWQGLSDGQIDDYEAALPPEWAGAQGAVHTAIDKIKTVRDNIEGCVAEVRRVLS